MLYNENDKYAAEWLRNLISAGELPGGDVDERSITELQADDILGHETVHFFAGIGGWPLALRIAGWPGDVPVWTGSCPCQPLLWFAGKHYLVTLPSLEPVNSTQVGAKGTSE